MKGTENFFDGITEFSKVKNPGASSGALDPRD
jgi:hypothetical protein